MTRHDRTLIDRLAGVVKGSAIDLAFRARAEARRNAEESYHLLFNPLVPGAASLRERRAVATFVAALHGEPRTLAHFEMLLSQTTGAGPALAALVRREAEQAAHQGPYGRFPTGPLSAEDLDGPVYRAAPAVRAQLGDHLAAALEHAHLLVLHPRDATADALEALVMAGWTTEGIVVLSQLVSFLTFQIRVVAGLRAAVLAPQPQSELVG